MKIISPKIKLTCLSFCLCLGGIQAQEVQKDSVFERNITVEREYTPVVRKTNRIDFTPVVCSHPTTTKEVVYTDFNHPIQTPKTIPTLDRARMFFPTPPQSKGFARFGLGLYWNTLAELNYQILDEKQTKLNLYANHNGIFRNRLLSETAFGVQLSHRLESSEIYFDAHASNEYFNYYGKCYVDSTQSYDFSHLDTLNNKHLGVWDVSAHIGWRSLANNQFNYLLQAGYNYYHLTPQMGTHTIDVNGQLSGSIAGNHLIGATLYNKTLFYMGETGNSSPRNHLHIEPFYQYNSDKLLIHAGVNVDFIFGNTFLFAPSPQVSFEWLADPDMVSLYINATGSVQMHSPASIMHENRYVELVSLMNDSNSTYQPIQANLGFKIKPVNGLLLNPYIRFSHIQNDVFFMFNSASKSYSAFNANVSVFDAGLTLNYHYQDKVDVNFGGSYHHWMSKPGETVWDKPSWDIWTDIRYNINNKWSVQADMTFIGQRKANVDNLERTLKPGYQINVGGIYTPNQWLSVFLKLNNIAHNQYEQFYAYKTYGFQLLAGASVAF